MMTTINGADVRTPRDAETAMQNTAQVYADLAVSIEQSRVNLSGQGVSGDAIDMLTAMLDAGTIVASATSSAAARFAAHQQAVADTVGADPTLAGTQEGRYMDPAAL